MRVLSFLLVFPGIFFSGCGAGIMTLPGSSTGSAGLPGVPGTTLALAGSNCSSGVTSSESFKVFVCSSGSSFLGVAQGGIYSVSDPLLEVGGELLMGGEP